jgi:AmmeMemoRadiSam system protein B/AmmeMemoRadiSam system protein A
VETAAEVQLEFDQDQTALLTDAAMRCVRATAAGAPGVAALPEDLATLPVFGIFVSLHRGDDLRACLGNWGREGTTPLVDLITRVARNAALDDRRFPRIQLAECDALSIELSLMTRPDLMTERGDELVKAIQVGTHGLCIAHPGGRGLLLPNVASERGWSARTFLERLCAKAGLSPQAWRESEARIESFRTVRVCGTPPNPEFNPSRLDRNCLRALVETAQKVLCGEPPPIENDPQLDTPRWEELGVWLSTEGGTTALALCRGASLRERTLQAAAQLRARQGGRRLAKFVLLWHAIELAAADYPQRHNAIRDRAVLAVRGQQHHLETRWAGDALTRSLQALGAEHDDWRREGVRVLSSATMALRLEPPKTEVRHAPVRKGQQSEDQRPPAVAGRFYPKRPGTMHREVQRHLGCSGKREAFRAVMLPHAGWAYCGSVLGQTLARVEVPARVILIGPRHHSQGANWSIAPHRTWQIPGAEIPVDVDLVAALCEALPSLEREPKAHAAEHSAEVLLPFLLELQPDLRIAPIAIGRASYDETQELAAGLARALDGQAEPPLIVISSDMNHFANEARTRKLDGIALDALKSGEPRALFDACTELDISMCGMRPAVATMGYLDAAGPIAPELVAYDTSATTSGDTNRVVGYAGAVFR